MSLTDNNLKQICGRRIVKNNVLLSSVVYMMDVETNACRGRVAVSHTVSETNLEDGRSLGSKGKLHCLFYVTCAFYTSLSGILCCFFFSPWALERIMSLKQLFVIMQSLYLSLPCDRSRTAITLS